MLKLPKIRLPSEEKRQDLIQETALIAGFFMLFYGLYQVWPPLAFVICGCFLMVFGAWDVLTALFLSRKGGG
ncbi:MAG: hypothetical protein WC364_13105 [Eubacteriales bacterium]|jgi:hypothetical protein